LHSNTVRARAVFETSIPKSVIAGKQAENEIRVSNLHPSLTFPTPAPACCLLRDLADLFARFNRSCCTESALNMDDVGAVLSGLEVDMG
jgi:hypothetical protein